MKRGAEKKHLKSDETSSGSSSAEKKEEVIEDRNESFDDPTSQKQTEAESEDETRVRLDLHGAKNQDELPKIQEPYIYFRQLSSLFFPMMPSSKPNKDPGMHRLQSKPGSADVHRPEQQKTESLLDETTSLSAEEQTPSSSLQPTGSKDLEHLSADILDEPYLGVLSRPTGIRQFTLRGASSTHQGFSSDWSLKRHPGSVFTQFSREQYLDFSPTSSPTVPCCDQETKQEKRETETKAEMNTRGVSFYQPIKENIHEGNSPESVFSTFRCSPYSYPGVHDPKEPVSMMSSSTFTDPDSQHKDAAFFSSSLPRQYALGSRVIGSISSPPSSSIFAYPSVADSQVLQRWEKRQPFIIKRKRKAASDQELSGQEKREEANPSSTPGYRRYLTSYQGPELLEDLSRQSTRQLKADDTHMEQKRSALIYHQHSQFPDPTPEYINTEMQEEVSSPSGSGSLSLSDLTEADLYEDPDPDQDLLESDPSIMADLLSATKALLTSSDVQFSSTDSCRSRRTSSRVPGSVSMTSLSSFEDFTPDVSEDDEDHEGYRFQCSCPGLYQCSVTGLVFDMEGEGVVVYRTVPWNRLLVQHHKKPAGPLFDIKCEQQSVRQLHLPHCQMFPTAGFLAVAHVKDDGVEFITPQKITETHLVINIRGFSGFGIAKDEDSPSEPVRALVLLFYKPSDDPDVTSVLNVLLLPKNIVIQDVQRSRKKLVGDERYIETSPHCKLVPDQVYILSTEPEDDLIKVQPTEAEFEEDSYDNYFPTFQVSLETTMKRLKLFLRDSRSQSVWERRVCLSSTGQIKSCGSNAPNEKLMNVRSSFIERTSGPILNSLLDKLLEKKVLADSERESADEMKNRSDKARFIIDTVRKKGDAASSEMIEFLCELDPFLCEHLGLM